MNDRPQSLNDAFLHAFVDGQLNKKKCKEVDVFVKENPEKAQQIRQYQVLNTQIHMLYDAVVEEPVPERFINAIKEKQKGNAADKKPTPRSVKTRLNNLHLDTSKPKIFNSIRTLLFGPSWSFRFVTYAIMIAVGSIIGWSLQSEFAPKNVKNAMLLAQHAIDAHVIFSAEGKHAIEVGAEEKAHLMKWLSKRIGAQVGPADLDRFGLSLLGGRLLPANGKHAGQYLYQNVNKKRLTLYITTHTGDYTRFTSGCTSQPVLVVCEWTKGPLAFYIVGDFPKSQMRQIYKVVEQQLPN